MTDGRIFPQPAIITTYLLCIVDMQYSYGIRAQGERSS